MIEIAWIFVVILGLCVIGHGVDRWAEVRLAESRQRQPAKEPSNG